MDRALEEIEFLALSANRVEVLNAVRERAHTRRELQERTGASQPTLGRILRDFEERNWVTATDGTYEATATGGLVAAGIVDLREILETELKLRDVVHWLPTEAMDFDLRRLDDATVTVPSRIRPGAPIGRMVDLVGRSDRVRIVSHAFNERSLEAVRARTVEGEATFEGVFSADAIDAVADDAALRARLSDLLAAENAEIRIAAEELPLAVTVTDRVVHLLVRDDDGVLQAALDTDDDAVWSWAVDVHDRYWRESTPLEREALED